ncbi:MAG: hypothetical protein RL316_854 [Bacteroidota bacterium]|jgi:hypothetical protein|nr:DUF3078 domain-containing protein [Chitinophagia bacterium]
MALARFILFFLLSLSYFFSDAQDASIRKLQVESLRPVKKYVPDSLIKKWKSGGNYTLTIGQGTLSNWAAGGDQFSLTVNTILQLYSYYRKGRNSWDNTLDIFFGYINTTSLGSRKNDDRFDLISKYGYSLNKKINLATLFNVRSQFIRGYTYPNNVKTFASSFLSPAYIIFSQGLDFRPNKQISVFFSPITARWVVVTNPVLSARGEYGVKAGTNSIGQFGAFGTVTIEKNFNKKVLYKSRLDLFSNYQRKPQNVDLFITNVLTTKIGKNLAFNWNVDLIYDDDVRLFGPRKSSPGLQAKSIIGLGLQVKF